MNPPRKQISQERQTTYYLGMALIVIGMLLFFSVFVTGIINVGNFEDFDSQVRSSSFRAITGMALVILGSILANLGEKGLAGSGAVLDLEKAREDLEPWSRMAGGMVQDALSEVNVVKKIEERGGNDQPLVKVRCRKCATLNEETAKFCNQCGAPL